MSSPYLIKPPKHDPLWQTLLPHTCSGIPRTISSVCALSPLCSRKLPWQARRRTIGSGRCASVPAIRGIGGAGACSGGPVVVCHSQACSGSTSCNRKAVSRPPQLSATTPSTVSAHPGDLRFPSCTTGSTPRPSEDAALLKWKGLCPR